MKTNYIQPQTIVVLISSDLMKINGDGGSAGGGFPSQPGTNAPLRNINTLYI